MGPGIAQVWRLPALSLVATLRGHKRGVWDVAFSPVDQVHGACNPFPRQLCANQGLCHEAALQTHCVGGLCI